MTDRNWDAELKAIDQQLASLSDDQLRAPPAPAGAGARSAARTAAPATLPAPGATAVSASAASGRGSLWVWVRALLAAGGVAGLVVWPYARGCGPYGMAYLAAAGVVALAGVWTAMGGWKWRSALAHLIGLASLSAAGVLAAIEVLPKVGYAIPTAEHGATWQCELPSGSSAPFTAPSAPGGPSSDGGSAPPGATRLAPEPPTSGGSPPPERVRL